MAGVLLILYLYTPVGDQPVRQIMVRVTVVPVLVIPGLLMWQMPRIRRLRWRRATRRA